MSSQSKKPGTWQIHEVRSPLLTQSVPVIAALDIPYVDGGHRFQTLSLYAPMSEETTALVGNDAIALPTPLQAGLPRVHVHIHGGAWRDPFLTSTSIEAAVAHAFTDSSRQLDVIASINYTLSPFPTHPTAPYDPVKDNHSDPAREGYHPRAVQDVLRGFALLRKQFGLIDKSYILSGHSAGACLTFQSSLKAPQYWQSDVVRPPTPAALVGLNGLYDLVELVQGLGPKHLAMREEYQRFQSITFGTDQSKWPAYSPARFDVDAMSARVKAGEIPNLILLDQSVDDQLVPINQRQRLELQLSLVDSVTVVQGHRCAGSHASPWENGDAIYDTIKDVLALLAQKQS